MELERIEIEAVIELGIAVKVEFGTEMIAEIESGIVL